MFTPQSPLFRLPISVRNHIYYLCARTSSPYSTTLGLIFHLNSCGKPQAYNESAKTVWSLLQTCQAIHEELTALIYSRGMFVIRYFGPGSLRSLLSLSTTTLASLTCLKIVLNQAACHGGLLSPCCRKNKWAPYWAFKSRDACTWAAHQSHDPPLRSDDTRSQEILEEWEATVVYLSQGLTAGRLELAVVCDVAYDDPCIATAVITSLRFLPRLKDCHVRLSAAREPKLLRMAESLVVGLTSNIQPRPKMLNTRGQAAGCNLLSLPREIRLRILEYTDLVTPLKEVNWFRQDRQHGPGYLASQMAPNRVAIDHHRPLHFQSGYRFGWCWREAGNKGPIGCFCRLDHSSASSSCRCWAPPTALFLICRKLCNEAQHIFFSRNRFIIRDNFDWLALVEYPHTSFAASDFLKFVVTEKCLSHLRFLELVFPAFSYRTWPLENHPAALDWTKTIKWARSKLNLPGLTLRLYVEDIVYCRHSDWPENYENLTRVQGDMITGGYARITAPFASWGEASEAEPGGLARFYAYYPVPWKWPTDQNYYDSLNEDECELKERWERHVLGDEHYERQRLVDEPLYSSWLWNFKREN